MKLDALGVRQVLGALTGSINFDGTLVDATVYAAGSAGTHVYDPDTRFALIVGCGGGGGGGGCPSTAGSSAAGGGGGSGAFFVYRTFSHHKIAYSVGAGGNGGASGTGSPGNSTTIGRTTTNPIVTAPGGHSGTAGSTSNRITAAVSFTPITGIADVLRSSQAGRLGENEPGVIAASGMGGSTPIGAGGAGRTTTGAGAAGTGFGAGGGGAVGINSGSNQAGGAGSGGVVIIIEYK